MVQFQKLANLAVCSLEMCVAHLILVAHLAAVAATRVRIPSSYQILYIKWKLGTESGPSITLGIRRVFLKYENLYTVYKNLAARGAPLTKFYFSKNHSGLKNECFGWKFANTFLLFQRKIAKKKIWNKKFEQYFLGSQISAIFVLLGLGNTQKNWVSLHYML